MASSESEHDAARSEPAFSVASPRPFVLAIAVGLLAAGVFGPSLAGEWVFDDHPLIADNIYIRSFAYWQRWLTHDFWDVSEEVKAFRQRMIYWRPGITASYALDWALGNGSPVMYHATNLLWHALTSMLAFALLRRWLGTTLPAFLATLLFALHPTKAESVAWISGRTDVLCAAAMIVAAHGMALRMRGSRRGWALEGLATAAAYLLKEQAIALAGFACVEAWVALGRPALRWREAIRMIRAGLPQLAVAMGYWIARHAWLPIKGRKLPDLGVWDHTLEVLESFGRYFELTVFPHDLSVQHGLMRTLGGRYLFEPRYIALGGMSLVVLGVVAWWLRERRPGVTVGIAFYGAMILPTSNIVTTDMATMISERFLYLPLLGTSLVAGTLLGSLAEPSIGRARIAIAGTAFVVGALAVGGWQRADDFVDEATFWDRELALHPDSLEALRVQIARAAADKRFEEAIELSAKGQSIAARLYSHSSNEVDFVLEGLELLLCTTPDRDRKTLRAIDRFFESLTDPAAAMATLDLPSLRVRIPMQRPSLARRVDILRPRILGLRAGIHSRLGDDATALRYAVEAHGTCLGCYEIGRIGALVAARAGQYQQANAMLNTVARWTTETKVAPMRTILRDAEQAARSSRVALDEPARLHWRASELAILEAWGRAFEVLAPAKDAIKDAPTFAIGFAELAWRAGEFEIAREMLSTLMTPEAALRTTGEWSEKMGWSRSRGAAGRQPGG